MRVSIALYGLFVCHFAVYSHCAPVSLVKHDGLPPCEVHPTLGILARFQAFFYASAFSQLDGVPPPAPARVTQTVRNRGQKIAEALLKDMRALPIKFYEASEERILAAANHAISYADSFVVQLAQELNGTLVTGDPEFKSVKNLKVLWLIE